MSRSEAAGRPVSVVMVGVSYHAAPIGLLERIVVPAAERPGLLAGLARVGFSEVVLVCTGSRCEIYAAAPGDPEESTEALLQILSGYCGVPVGQLERVARARTGTALARHLLRVAAGLDSRVFHDADVADQLAQAAAESGRAAMLGPELTALFAAAAAAAGDARMHAARRSALTWAVDVGLAAAGRPEPETWGRIMIVGYGRAAMAVLGHLTDKGLPAHTVITPPVDLAGADLVICLSPGPDRAITVDMARAATRTGKRLTIVDTCLPRSVEPALAEVPGVLLLDLDDLDDDTEALHRLGVTAESTLCPLLAEQATATVRSRASGATDRLLHAV